MKNYFLQFVIGLANWAFIDWTRWGGMTHACVWNRYTEVYGFALGTPHVTLLYIHAESITLCRTIVYRVIIRCHPTSSEPKVDYASFLSYRRIPWWFIIYSPPLPNFHRWKKDDVIPNGSPTKERIKSHAARFTIK